MAITKTARNLPDPPDVQTLRDAFDEAKLTYDELMVALKESQPFPSEAAALIDSTDRASGPADTIDIAARSLAACPESVRRLSCLADRPGRKAHLDDIAIALRGAHRATARNQRQTVRQCFNRTRNRLEEKGAVVRLEIDQNIVSLVVIPSKSEDATQK